MIGGTDVVYLVPRGLPASDVIIGAVRQHWPDYIFVDADDPNPPRARPDWAIPSPAGSEFVIYRDAEAAQSWESQGATADNKNAMLYVVLGGAVPNTDLRSVTIVFGELAGALGVLERELRSALRDVQDTDMTAHGSAPGRLS